jgi:hypothetical protein
MNTWIFTVTKHKVHGETFAADDILNQQMVKAEPLTVPSLVPFFL